MVTKQSNFILLHVAFQFSQYHLLKRLSGLHCMFLALLSKLFAHIYVSLFLGFQFCSISLCVCFSANIMLFWLLSLCSMIWGQRVWYLWPCSFFLRISLPSRGFLWFHINSFSHIYTGWMVKLMFGIYGAEESYIFL